MEHFFIGTGFRCPPRTDIPDFLQEVTSRKDQVCLAAVYCVACTSKACIVIGGMLLSRLCFDVCGLQRQHVPVDAGAVQTGFIF